jgi:uncharacterized protein (DUF1684 family)
MNLKYPILLSLAILLSGCSCKISSDYLHHFYADRQEQMIHLVSGERAPLDPNDLANINHFPYQEDHCVKARFSPTVNPVPFDMSTVSGQTKQFIEVGTLSFKLNQQKSTIHVYQEVRFINHPVYGSSYFIPFNDESNGNQTYGGGRYMDIKKSLFDGNSVMLDFNKAYNPWCAYAEGYNCPIPPSENYQSMSILAGEKSYTKVNSH